MTNYSPESGHRADPQRLLDRIVDEYQRNARDVDPSQTPNRSLDWDSQHDRQMVTERFRQNADVDIPLLPGFGPQGRARNAKDDCGDDHPFVCDSCGHTVSFGRTCGMSVCARCGVAWCRDSAISKAAKVRRVRKVKHGETPDSEHQKIHHVVISPPLGLFYDLAKDGYTLEDAYQIVKQIVKIVLEELRAQGVLARHSFRGSNDDGSIASESDDRGRWKERLNSGREFYGDVRDELAWKPHFHAIVVSDFIKGDDLTETLEQETGWVVHRIADDDGVSLGNDGDMARALTYTISHTDIEVNPNGHNQSALWEIGTFQGDAIKSSGRFSPPPADHQWADNVVRKYAGQVLGLSSATTECGTEIPAVDDPDELARRALEELYPDDDRDVDTDTVLHHISQGNIRVDVSTTSGGGGDVTVRDAFGEPVGAGGWGGSLPSENATYGATDDDTDVTQHPAVNVVDDDPDDDTCGCGDDHDDTDAPNQCDGRLIPLGEARDRGLLEDAHWRRNAPHADEAREADRQWPDDLERWRSTTPDEVQAIGVG